MRPYNFAAGPAALPESVLKQAAAEMLDWQGTGLSVMEMSHRGAAFSQICAEAEADVRELLDIPNDYAVLFVQGGGLGHNAFVPFNLLECRNQSKRADFVITGAWSKKSHHEGTRYGDMHIAASNQTPQHDVSSGCYIPALEDWNVRADANYLHLCTNETIGGVEFQNIPDLSLIQRADIPLVMDASSHILSRPLDVSKAGLVFAGAQKNIGPAGVTLVIAKRALLGKAWSLCPSAFDFSIIDQHQSCYNTPPTYAIYIAGLVFKWLKAQGGIPAIEAANIKKASHLYQTLDASAFYDNPIQPEARSRMNVPFFLRDESLNAVFLKEAEQAHLLQLKGHKSAGGMRASIYNAMPFEGVQALCDFLKDFERRYG